MPFTPPPAPFQSPTMKIALPSILLISLIAVSKGQSAGPGPINAENHAPSPATEEADVSGDAGKECAAEECTAADDENGAADESTETVAESSDESTEATAESETEEEDANCPSRPHVIRCAAKYLDTNQNGRLEREELESVMQTVPWLLRGEFLFDVPVLCL